MIFIDPFLREHNPEYVHLAVWNARNLVGKYRGAAVCIEPGHYVVTGKDLVIWDAADWVRQISVDVVGKPQILEYWPTDGRSPTERPDLRLSPAYYNHRLGRALEFLCGWEIAFATHMDRQLPLDKDGVVVGKKVIAWAELERFILRMEATKCSLNEIQTAITPILSHLYQEAKMWEKVIPERQFRPPRFDRLDWVKFGNVWRLVHDDRCLEIQSSLEPMKLAAYMTRLKPSIEVIIIAAGDTAGFLKKLPQDEALYKATSGSLEYAKRLLRDLIKPDRDGDLRWLGGPWFPPGYSAFVGRKLRSDITVRNLRKHLQYHNLFI